MWGPFATQKFLAKFFSLSLRPTRHKPPSPRVRYDLRLPRRPARVIGRLDLLTGDADSSSLIVIVGIGLNVRHFEHALNAPQQFLGERVLARLQRVVDVGQRLSNPSECLDASSRDVETIVVIGETLPG